MNKKAHEISIRQILAYTRLGTGVKSPPAQPRQTGRYCSCCKGPLPPHTRGTRYCILCHPGAKLHTVYVPVADDWLSHEVHFNGLNGFIAF